MLQALRSGGHYRRLGKDWWLARVLSSFNPEYRKKLITTRATDNKSGRDLKELDESSQDAGDQTGDENQRRRPCHA